ncbi:MAG: DUF883 family protein [Hoeflea sp.]|uniref:DUF883 family protein n=1 Tax=Hoeflea sp. TaxID=1940281 RepID=UPI001D5DD881|nr:DUF883 C-terminal domain-containing protein [Hoeflea sp.]MBU4529223.1 DUF883 family protein [Alphaproteobacteria bacterium]MBU4543627.1 DUF883 family protein [Alphaproteobacteria bacterium]MBU4549253.1 DUF883 family protein [Alphaproteobacteria bacterium]MBV1725386.1 DUF883 family protein [Hoeflea sp.]MBV1785349.1 DUF883 family protein [Hoeflea sp.]
MASTNKSHSIDEIAERTAKIREDLAALGEALAGAGAMQAGVARDAAEKRVEEVLHSGQKLVSEMSGQFSSAEKKVVANVREHPLQSLGIAVAAGFLAALLMRR